MDPVVFFSWIYTKYGYYKTFTGIFANELSRFLASVGTSQYRAALQHLENAKHVTGRDQHDQYLLAAGALESAVQLFLDSIPKGFKSFVSALVPGGGHEKAMGYLGAAEAASLAATCYINMGNSKLAKNYMMRAEDFFSDYISAEVEYQERTQVWNNGGVPTPIPGAMKREKNRINREIETFNKVLSKAGVG